MAKRPKIGDIAICRGHVNVYGDFTIQEVVKKEGDGYECRGEQTIYRTQRKAVITRNVWWSKRDRDFRFSIQHATDEARNDVPVEAKPTEFVKPVVTLVGTDGNAFSIIGKVARALKQAGFPDKAQEFQAEAMKGDYDHLLQTAMTYAEVR